MTNILVTGASGFAGRSLLELLDGNEKYEVFATYNTSPPDRLYCGETNIKWKKFDIGAEINDYSSLLKEIDIVVHLAAKVHSPEKNKINIQNFKNINATGTERLAIEAAQKGVTRFIYISTVKVHGEHSPFDESMQYCHRFIETDCTQPIDAYGKSKLEAEKAIIRICLSAGMNYVIFRPPLIYGPGVKANFLRLIKLVDRNIPLPFRSIYNLRSLLYVENFCQAILLSIEHERAKNQVFLISDNDISLTDLIYKIAHNLDKKPVLFNFPVILLKIAGKITGNSETLNRLTGSLLINNNKIKKELGWQPKFNIDEAMMRTIDWYKKYR